MRRSFKNILVFAIESRGKSDLENFGHRIIITSSYLSSYQSISFVCMLKTTHRRTNGNSNKFFDKVNRGYRVEYYRPEMIISRPSGTYIIWDGGNLSPITFGTYVR